MKPRNGLGKAYDKGPLGLVNDEDEALKWHRKAAEGGYFFAAPTR